MSITVLIGPAHRVHVHILHVYIYIHECYEHVSACTVLHEFDERVSAGTDNVNLYFPGGLIEQRLFHLPSPTAGPE